MQVIENENIVAIDVDGTLVAPYSRLQSYSEEDEDRQIRILNPYSNTISWFIPLHQHVELLKQYKGRELFVIVWSAGGAKWAEAVVKTLELQEYVDLIMTKPSKLVDDLSPEEIFPTRIFLKDNV